MLVKFPNFPNTVHDPFLATSPPTTSYNCIAWAANDNSRWYWPDPHGYYFWPVDIPREENVRAFILLFESLGYIKCDNGNHEPEYQKVAIYALNDKPTHAARQLDNGMWTSKLGRQIDVQHNLNNISGGVYGEVVQFLKKEI